MDKLLITGSSGQVGRVFVRKLMKNNCSFVGLDLRPNESLNYKFLRIDITNKKSLDNHKSILKNFDSLIHLASVVNTEQNITKNGTSSVNLNIHGTLNLLEYLPNLKFICFASTYMVYGIPNSNPVTEEHATEPTTIYGTSKLITEKFLQVYTKKQNIDLSILRFMGIYGLESPYAVQAIPSFIRLIAKNKNPSLFGQGKTKRNHIYVDDAISAILISLKKKKSGMFNIGGPDAPTNLEIINLINRKMQKKIKPILKKSADVQYNFITDISLAHNKLGFKPKISIVDGVAKSIERYFLIEKNDLQTF